MIQPKAIDTDGNLSYIPWQFFKMKSGATFRVENGEGRREFVGPFDYDTFCWIERDRFRIKIKA